MNYPKFLMAQITSSWPTGPTRFVEIPKIPDKELERFCALSNLWKETVFSASQLRAMEVELDKRLKERSYMQEEILQWMKRECPSTLVDDRLREIEKKKTPPPPPVPSGDNRVCVFCTSDGQFRMVSPSDAKKPGCSIVPEDRCRPPQAAATVVPPPPATPTRVPVTFSWTYTCDLLDNLFVAAGREDKLIASGASSADIAAAKRATRAAAQEAEERMRGAFKDEQEIEAFLKWCNQPVGLLKILPYGRRWMIQTPPTPTSYYRPQVQPQTPPLMPTGYYQPQSQAQAQMQPQQTLPTVYARSGGPSMPTTTPPARVVQNTGYEGSPSAPSSARVLPGMLPGLLTTATPGMTMPGGASTISYS